MSTHGVTDAQVDAVLASRHTGEDGQDAGGEVWYRNPELRTLWGDEFSAMHALAQAVKDAQAELASVRADLSAAEAERDEAVADAESWYAQCSDARDLALKLGKELDAARIDRDEARAMLLAKLPGMSELDEKLADHRRWVKDQRMMRTAIAPVNVQAVGDLLREMDSLCAAGLEVERERDALAAQVAAMREALESVPAWTRALGEHGPQIVVESEAAQDARWIHDPAFVTKLAEVMRVYADAMAHVQERRHAEILADPSPRAEALLAVYRAACSLVDGMPYTMGAAGEGQHNALRDAVDAARRGGACRATQPGAQEDKP